MKFSTFASTLLGAALVFASKAVADVDYFDYPAPNSVFRAGKSIQFVVDDMPDGDDGDDRVYADLYRENGRFVKTIRSWWGDDVHDDDEFAFSWTIDRNLKSGRYFVEMYSDDDDDNDDVARSFVFEVIAPPRVVTSPTSGGVVTKGGVMRRPTAAGFANRRPGKPLRGGRRVINKGRYTK